MLRSHMRGARRLRFGTIVALLFVAVVVASGVVGAAAAPSPVPEPEPAPEVQAGPEGKPEPESAPDEAAAPSSVPHSAIGIVRRIRPQSLTVEVTSLDSPLVVTVRPSTALRIGGRRVTTQDLRVGDVVLAIGRPGPRENLVASVVALVHRTKPEPRR
ncbi:MAG: hypothetical protein GEU73_02360 [Chloroflexi bacterium]|nr:hypothetical protein [Chloroflexota bacterium]